MEIRILCHNFEWQARPLSMDLKYSEALCELTESMMHVGKLISFSECWVLLKPHRNVKSLLGLERKEPTNCSPVPDAP